MKILIVEDDANSRVFLERALLSQGYTVESAANGVRALEKATLSPPDLIISDIMMPEMDGFELCRRIKTDERLHTIPFVFYTATYVEDKDEKLGMALGAARFLIKPMEPEAFFRTISGIIKEDRAGHIPLPDRLPADMTELDRMQVEIYARKLDKKVRELEKERDAIRRADEEITRLNAELEQRVIERTAQLDAANKELEAFSYSVSHDLRAPLRAIDGFAEILLREYSPKLDDEGKRICSIITGNSRKMGQLIDELLSLARIGRAEMHFTPINMKEIVHEVYLELTTPEMRQKIDFHIDDLKKAAGDLILIRQVWMNLISNAIKFTSRCEQPVISITSKEEEDQVVYRVKDNGAGFNMQYADKLFGVFQRLHSESEFKGTGVGLAIVQRVVNRHGGKVWAEGEVGKGATFCFSLSK